MRQFVRLNPDSLGRESVAGGRRGGPTVGAFAADGNQMATRANAANEFHFSGT
jgi:hypothetical protein